MKTIEASNNDIIVYEDGSGSIRMCIKNGGAIYYSAADVLTSLGYNSSSSWYYTNKLCDDNDIIVLKYSGSMLRMVNADAALNKLVGTLCKRAEKLNKVTSFLTSAGKFALKRWNETNYPGKFEKVAVGGNSETHEQVKQGEKEQENNSDNSSKAFGNIRAAVVNGEVMFNFEDMATLLGYKDAFDEIKNALRSYESKVAEIKGMLENHENRINTVEGMVPISDEQWITLSEAIDQAIVAIIGGESSESYNNFHLRYEVRKEFEDDMKECFEVESLRNILAKHFDKVMEYIKLWKPCVNTQMKISNCNSLEK